MCHPDRQPTHYAAIFVQSRSWLHKQILTVHAGLRVERKKWGQWLEETRVQQAKPSANLKDTNRDLQIQQMQQGLQFPSWF